MFLVEAAQLTGRGEEAIAVVDEMEEVAKVTPAPILHHQLAYARAALAADGDAESLYLAALASDLDQWPWVRARLELAYGTWLSDHGRHDQGQALLFAVRGKLEKIGASHWVHVAEQELNQRRGTVLGLQ